ncbi:hypothetical protein KNT87_gp071 [Erwinia phage Cronus]|uniref:Uncharacterized protein n=1 Tax=Erwinia phage Cronus TaxID=2163633 RepID=A0A2S1GMA7_9CAUD|nr:hypothetical protein KNT87_gp071 [Erwinia phage Cronus]AWD90510.1 hypothetical protein [Erwinia phage Cronus]
MKDFLGNELFIGDRVAIYFGGNGLTIAYIAKICPKYERCKVRPEYYPQGEYSPKWKTSECMVKI